jgi:membrane-associated phospholipid phosphatase
MKEELNRKLSWLFGFTPVDLLLITYFVLTGFYIIAFSSRLDRVTYHLLLRIAFISFIFIIRQFEGHDRILAFIRSFYPLMLLSFIYAETDYMNNVLFANFDSLVSNWDFLLFGIQPSILFAEYVTGRWFAECMYLGYFSYYFMTFGLCLWIYIKQPVLFEKILFLIVFPFIVYYFIFIFFPVAGPQFYFKEVVEVPEGFGIFSGAVHFLQGLGERPTAAFPSSHIGISIILVYLAYRHAPRLLVVFIPCFLFLFMATVYIRAHYVVDVIAGILTGPLLCMLADKIYVSYTKPIVVAE